MKLIRTHSLDEAVTEIFGSHVHIAGRHSVYGGDINQSFRLQLSDGSSLFLKCSRPENLSFFEAEAKGLEALRLADAVGVPKVLAAGTDPAQNHAFLLMEFLDAAPRIRGYWEIFGKELAALHLAGTKGLSGSHDGLPFGFESDNYIGASPQKNTPKESWISFFRDCRLSPQIHMAGHYLDSRKRRQCTRLLDHLESWLEEPRRPSLIHGDLWSGNAGCGPDGKAWIFDPAAYVGHFEAELAMTELFGCNPPAFYEAYKEVNSFDSGYRDRRDLYNLYHLFNHLNLFGSAYLGAVAGSLDRYA